MKRLIWLLAALLLAGCDNDPADPGVSEDQLTFLRFESASALTVREASFWAVKGDGRRLEIDYVDGEEFLEFDVSGNSLLSRPDGTLFQDRDSVLITVQVDASNRLIVHFEPSGLVFNPLAPARLEINYKHADEDIDGDGQRDQDDEVLEQQLRIWKQERPGLPWLPQPSVRIDEDDIEARVLSFTGFAMAS